MIRFKIYCLQDRRPPLNGSICIEGATLDRARLVNGIFEPTLEKCNGMTVYRKKSDPGLWLEIVSFKPDDWRW